MKFITRKEALAYVGGLSEPSKMPGYGWSISAKRCKRGAKLRFAAREHPDPEVRKIFSETTCAKCYALKGHYVYDNVYQAHENRYNSMFKEFWINAMTFLIKDEKYFRWFDSGDLQDVEHLEKIVKVCKNTPNCKHWLPTRETDILKQYIKIQRLKKKKPFPDNLCIRISTDFTDTYPVTQLHGCQISTTSKTKWDNQVKNHGAKNIKACNSCQKAHNCPVSVVPEFKSCDDANCRKCWDTSVYHINYKLH